ncbi:MAG: cell envelope integrity protein CreD [Geobacteraceae bacterium]|nr:cell envelope integrity protein CreD [Geobacteraceae bacterium]
MSEGSRFSRMGQSAMTKLLVIAGLVLALLVPVEMVKGIIHERDMRRKEVVADVGGKWGKEQTIAGPVLTIPYRSYVTDDKGKRSMVIEHAHLLPEQLQINGTIKPDSRYRGIYQVVVYNAALQVGAEFTTSGLAELGIPEKDVIWDGAVVSVGLPDLRGLKENSQLIWEGGQYPINPGVGVQSIMTSGINSKVPVSAAKKRYHFQISLNLNGSGQIMFLPLGKTTTVQLASSWKSPSFIGPFLPDERVINDKGFNATWKVLHLNRSYPQQWSGGNDKVLESAFGTKLFYPVDEYQKSMRSAKYAVLFIILTLTAFFITEVINRVRVHPIQYLLIGCAICLFYVLLLSVSEHSSFAVAYLVSGIASTLLVSLYAKAVLRSVPVTLTIGGLMSFLYGFLYVILQQEDYALLIGSVGMFVVLAAVMYLTRKVDWYGVNNGNSQA